MEPHRDIAPQTAYVYQPANSWIGWGWRFLEVFGAPIFGVGIFLIVWEIASYQVENSAILPPASKVLNALAVMVSGGIASDIIASLKHLAIGYGLGILAGIFLAFATARFRYAGVVIEAFAEFLRPISAIAWIPIAIMLFGIGSEVPVFLIFYASLFPIFVNTLFGIRQVSVSLQNAAASLGASSNFTVSHVILPAALPHLFTGARLSLGVAWMAMVAAELIGGESGLGWRIMWYQEFFQMDRVMAIIVIIGVFGFLADLILRRLQVALLPWVTEEVR